MIAGVRGPTNRGEMSQLNGSSGSNPDVAPGKALILIVEDVPVIHDVIELSLRALDAKCEFHTDGTEALEWLETNLPDMVVLDLALPGTDGWAILKHMRAEPRLARIPVVVVTAHGPGIEEDVMELGANAYLDKPFLPSTLRSIANELLGRS